MCFWGKIVSKESHVKMTFDFADYMDVAYGTCLIVGIKQKGDESLSGLADKILILVKIDYTDAKKRKYAAIQMQLCTLCMKM